MLPKASEKTKSPTKRTNRMREGVGVQVAREAAPSNFGGVTHAVNQSSTYDIAEACGGA